MESELHSERTEDYKKFKKSWESVFLERMYHFFPKTRLLFINFLSFLLFLLTKTKFNFFSNKLKNRGKVESIEIGTPLSTEHFLAADRGGSYGLEWTRDRFEVRNI